MEQGRPSGRNRREGQYFVPDGFGNFSQLQFRFTRAIGRTDDADANGRFAECDLLDQRIFRKHWEARDSIDLAIDFRQLMAIGASLAGRTLPDGPPVLIWVSVSAVGTRYEVQAHLDLLALGNLSKSMR